MRLIVQLCLAVVFGLGSGPVSGQVLISEIMYNPDSHEGDPQKERDYNQTEWIELYNAGDKAVSLAGFYLQDEDGKTEALAESVEIKPGEAIVLIPGTQSVGDFRKAWGGGFDVYSLKGWAVGDDPLSNLANGPSSSNEVLTLRDAEGEIVDEVNYDDEGDWPKDSPDGPSIALNPDALDPGKNDSGSNWRRSEKGKQGAKNAKKTSEYSDQDVGSPGRVPTK
ncbi:MAG: lamin tail domain-containing protein [Planctomycetota bacterium]